MKMQARARTRYLRMSPKKMRQVADIVKGKPVEEAIGLLRFTPKLAATYLAKTIKSAASNAISTVGTAKLKAEDLQISNIMVDSAPTAKRVRFQAMGRVHRIRKRFCHLTVEVEGEQIAEEVKTKSRRKVKAEEEAPKPAIKKKTKKSKAKADEVVDKVATVESVKVEKAPNDAVEDKAKDADKKSSAEDDS